MKFLSPGQQCLTILKAAGCIRLDDLARRLCVEESTAQQYVSLARDLTAGTDWYITTEYRPTKYRIAKYKDEKQMELIRRRETQTKAQVQSKRKNHVEISRNGSPDI